ncbi:glycosyl transferase family 2 [bacterium SM23_31]|nr:MAG: glycosyl transferase family 2 [bacterium SM23_31]
MTVDISAVVPLYNERESLPELTNTVRESLLSTGRSFEMIFIDDGSTDGSFEALLDLKKSVPEMRIIQLQKNHGKSAALSTGFAYARGEFVVTIDADLQDDPKEIPALLKKLDEGYDLVSGWKKNRQDPFSKKITSKFFNLVTSFTTRTYLHDHNCGLKAYRRSVIEHLFIYGQLHRFMPSLAHSNGFRVTEVVVTHHQRKYGKTKYGFWRFFAGFFDLLTVLYLTKFTTRPLHLFGSIGLVSFLTGFFINLHLTIRKYFYHEGVSNRPLLFLGILLILIGIQSFSLGLLAEMITNIRSRDKKYVIKNIYD